MRNVFDQYQQPENRLTHAVISTLNHDRSLQVGFRGEAVMDGGETLSILVEKDFQRLRHDGDEDESAMYPHPEAAR